MFEGLDFRIFGGFRLFEFRVEGSDFRVLWGFSAGVQPRGKVKLAANTCWVACAKAWLSDCLVFRTTPLPGGLMTILVSF